MVDVVVPIVAADAAGIAAQAHQARAEGADLVEVRLDVCARLAGQHGALPAIIATLGTLALPTILTIRHPSEGGDWDGGEDERAALYAAGDRAGATWVDCELAHRNRVIQDARRAPSSSSATTTSPAWAETSRRWSPACAPPAPTSPRSP